MPNEKLLRKQKEQHSYLEISDYMEDTKSQDYKKLRHNMDAFGGESEYNAMVERYEKGGVTISEEEKEELKNNMPPEPDFRVLSEEEYKSKNRIGRHKYNKDVKNYMKKRKKYFKTKADQKNEVGQKDASKFLNLRDKLEKDYRYYNNTEEGLVEKYTKAGLYKDIEASPDAMDAAYQEMATNKEFEEAERLVGKVSNGVVYKGKHFSEEISSYTGAYYGQINGAMRSGNANEFKGLGLYNNMKKVKLSRDLVVRRGVRGVGAIANMMGLANADKLSMETIKDKLKETLEGKETEGGLIISDKGFMSTSLPYIKKPCFSATGFSDKDVGIEFIILCRKGTQAMNISNISSKRSEEELLINANTKFRVVEAYLDGEKELINGDKNSWKIYLETIPGDDEGVMREENE